MRRFRLRARFILILVVLLVAMFTAILLVIVQANRHTLRTGLLNQSKSFAALATQPIGDNFVLYDDSGTIRIHQKIDSFTSLDNDISQVEVVDTNGKILFMDNPSPEIHVSQTAAAAVNPTYVYDKAGNLASIVMPYVESFGVHRYNIVYSVSYENVNRSVQQIVTLILALCIVVLLLSMIAWYVLINRLFLRPVAQISKDARLISQGELSRSIHVGRNDEIGDLAVAVNTMASSLKDDIAKLKEVDRLKNEFLMITSHNLRTPLTIIQGYVDEMKMAQSIEQIVREMLEPVVANVHRLQGFAEDVLAISTIEAGQDAIHLEPMAMQPVLERIAEEFESLARQKKVTFQVETATDAWAALDKPRFRSALWNLLDNAAKFTNEGGTIGLKVTTHDGRLEMAVSDTGIGISQTELPKLFTKFHRGTDTLTYNYEGTGIGLYLAKLIAKQHGGDINVQSTHGKGSTFTVWLPTVPPSPDQPK